MDDDRMAGECRDASIPGFFDACGVAEHRARRTSGGADKS